jgi:putative inorganic carbon (HCO3(-)) transporter
VGPPQPQPVVGEAPRAGFTILIAITLCMLLSIPEWVPGLGVVHPTVILTLVLIAMSVANFARLKHRIQNPPARALIGMVVYILVTIPLVYWPGSVINNFQHLITAFGYFFFIAFYVDTVRRLQIFVAVYLSAQTFRVLAPLFLHVTTGYWGDQTYLGDDTGFIPRLSGAPFDIVNANGLASLVIITLPFLFFWGRSKSKWILLGFVLPVSLALMYALMLTLSRSTLLALFIEGLAVLMFSKRRALILAVLVAGTVIGVSSLSDLQKERFIGSLYSSKAKGADTAKGRVTGLYDDIDVWVERPFFGFGFGTSFEALYNLRQANTMSHTLYTEALIELGIFGVPFLLAYLYRLCQAAWEGHKLATKNAERLAVAPILLWMPPSALVWLIGYLFFSIASYGLSTYTWYLTGGMIVATTNIIKDLLKAPGTTAEATPTPSRPARKTLPMPRPRIG